MGNKRDERLKRKAAKRKIQLDKKTRQLENPNAFKRVTETSGLHPSKSVSQIDIPINKKYMVWTRDMEDRDGSWSWGPRACCHVTWSTKVEPYLNEYSRKTWGQIEAEKTNAKGGKRKKKHISVHQSKLNSEPKKRLIELGFDDFEELFRFRFSGNKRIWGFRVGETFHYLWWDEGRKIYEYKHEK